MTKIQSFFMRILPKRWGESMQAESQSWHIRCSTCGHSRSVWEAGGIRWGAYSVGKQTKVHCPQCGTIRTATFERIPDAN